MAAINQVLYQMPMRDALEADEVDVGRVFEIIAGALGKSDTYEVVLRARGKVPAAAAASPSARPLVAVEEDAAMEDSSAAAAAPSKGKQVKSKMEDIEEEEDEKKKPSKLKAKPSPKKVSPTSSKKKKKERADSDCSASEQESSSSSSSSSEEEPEPVKKKKKKNTTPPGSAKKAPAPVEDYEGLSLEQIYKKLTATQKFSAHNTQPYLVQTLASGSKNDKKCADQHKRLKQWIAVAHQKKDSSKWIDLFALVENDGSFLIHWIADCINDQASAKLIKWLAQVQPKTQFMLPTRQPRYRRPAGATPVEIARARGNEATVQALEDVIAGVGKGKQAAKVALKASSKTSIEAEAQKRFEKEEKKSKVQKQQQAPTKDQLAALRRAEMLEADKHPEQEQFPSDVDEDDDEYELPRSAMFRYHNAKTGEVQSVVVPIKKTTYSEWNTIKLSKIAGDKLVQWENTNKEWRRMEEQEGPFRGLVQKLTIIKPDPDILQCDTKNCGAPAVMGSLLCKECKDQEKKKEQQKCSLCDHQQFTLFECIDENDVVLRLCGDCHFEAKKKTLKCIYCKTPMDPERRKLNIAHCAKCNEKTLKCIGCKKIVPKSEAQSGHDMIANKEIGPYCPTCYGKAFSDILANAIKNGSKAEEARETTAAAGALIKCEARKCGKSVESNEIHLMFDRYGNKQRICTACSHKTNEYFTTPKAKCFGQDKNVCCMDKGQEHLRMGMHHGLDKDKNDVFYCTCCHKKRTAGGPCRDGVDERNCLTCGVFMDDKEVDDDDNKPTAECPNCLEPVCMECGEDLTEEEKGKYPVLKEDKSTFYCEKCFNSNKPIQPCDVCKKEFNKEKMWEAHNKANDNVYHCRACHIDAALKKLKQEEKDKCMGCLNKMTKKDVNPEGDLLLSCQKCTLKACKLPCDFCTATLKVEDLLSDDNVNTQRVCMQCVKSSKEKGAMCTQCGDFHKRKLKDGVCGACKGEDEDEYDDEDDLQCDECEKHFPEDDLNEGLCERCSAEKYGQTVCGGGCGEFFEKDDMEGPENHSITDENGEGVYACEVCVEKDDKKRKAAGEIVCHGCCKYFPKDKLTADRKDRRDDEGKVKLRCEACQKTKDDEDKEEIVCVVPGCENRIEDKTNGQGYVFSPADTVCESCKAKKCTGCSNTLDLNTLVSGSTLCQECQEEKQKCKECKYQLHKGDHLNAEGLCKICAGKDAAERAKCPACDKKFDKISMADPAEHNITDKDGKRVLACYDCVEKQDKEDKKKHCKECDQDRHPIGRCKCNRAFHCANKDCYKPLIKDFSPADGLCPECHSKEQAHEKKLEELNKENKDRRFEEEEEEDGDEDPAIKRSDAAAKKARIEARASARAAALESARTRQESPLVAPKEGAKHITFSPSTAKGDSTGTAATVELEKDAPIEQKSNGDAAVVMEDEVSHKAEAAPTATPMEEDVAPAAETELAATSAASAGAPLSPLPPNWNESEDDNGRLWYWNDVTGETTRERPQPVAVVLKPKPPPPPPSPAKKQAVKRKAVEEEKKEEQQQTEEEKKNKKARQDDPSPTSSTPPLTQLSQPFASSSTSAAAAAPKTFSITTAELRAMAALEDDEEE